ncbi:unnamed protein product [Discosporangium mesarthrocarpum]
MKRRRVSACLLIGLVPLALYAAYEGVERLRLCCLSSGQGLKTQPQQNRKWWTSLDLAPSKKGLVAASLASAWEALEFVALDVNNKIDQEVLIGVYSRGKDDGREGMRRQRPHNEKEGQPFYESAMWWVCATVIATSCGFVTAILLVDLLIGSTQVESRERAGYRCPSSPPLSSTSGGGHGNRDSGTLCNIFDRFNSFTEEQGGDSVQETQQRREGRASRGTMSSEGRGGRRAGQERYECHSDDGTDDSDNNGLGRHRTPEAFRHSMPPGGPVRLRHVVKSQRKTQHALRRRQSFVVDLGTDDFEFE